MRFELRFPEEDRAHDEFIEEHIRSAVAFVSEDTGVDLAALAADDPRLAAWQAVVIVVARAFYDGAGRMPTAYAAMAARLRRVV